MRCCRRSPWTAARLTIRKFSKEPFTVRDLVTIGTLSRSAADVLEACVRGRLNILISGGTGSGKTTTLNVMSSFIPDDERIITVEDAAELQLLAAACRAHGVPTVERRGQGQVTIRDLVRNTLRMRPDRIIVGEVRDSAALDMLQAMNTGHDGSLSTVHANTPRDALSRIETMVLMAGMDLPVRVIREQVVSAIQLVVQQARLRDGSRHITQISEITGQEGDMVLMQDLFAFDYNNSGSGGGPGRLLPTGITPDLRRAAPRSRGGVVERVLQAAVDQVMLRVRSLALLMVALLVAAVALPSVARAEEVNSIQVVDQQGRVIEYLVYLDPLLPLTATSEVSSKVVISAVEVPSEASVIVESAGDREVIIAMDTSGSMKGDRIVAARAAAEAYVNALPADVKVGLVSFDDNVETAIAPTLDREAILAEIGNLTAGQKTAMFDGIVAGLNLASLDAQSRLLLVSDGGDTASTSTLDDVMGRLPSEQVPVDVVALTPNEQHAGILEGMAAASGGRYIVAADEAGLTKAFDEASGSFGGKITVIATVPPEVNASGTFSVVTVDVDGTRYTGTAKTPISQELVNTAGETTPSTVIPEGSGQSRILGAESSNYYPWLYGTLSALIIVVLFLTMAYYKRQEKSFNRTQQVLWYSNAVMSGTRGTARPELQQQSLVVGIDRWLAKRDSYAAREAKLDNAELTMTPGSWLIMRLGITLMLVFLLAILLGSLWIGLVIGGAIGWLGTRTYVNSREEKVRKKFETELPDFLLLIASALRSGLSFSQAVDSTAAEGVGQVARQMRRAMRETQMGSPIEASLMRAADRMDNDDLRWTVTALAIQREVGGNLSNILETAAATVQGRAELRREVRTLSAEGKLSGWVLAALPLGVFLYMLLVNREYVSFFWTQTPGMIAMGVLLVLFGIGFLWMRKLVRIRV